MVDEVAAENRCNMQSATARAVGFENAPAQRSGQQSDSRIVALYKNGYISEISAPSAAECLKRIDYPPARPQRLESLYRNRAAGVNPKRPGIKTREPLRCGRNGIVDKRYDIYVGIGSDRIETVSRASGREFLGMGKRPAVDLHHSVAKCRDK